MTPIKEYLTKGTTPLDKEEFLRVKNEISAIYDARWGLISKITPTTLTKVRRTSGSQLLDSIIS